MREVREQSSGKLSAHIGEGIAVEEEEGSAPVAVAKEVYRFFKGELLLLLFAPLACKRFVSLSINAVLRSTSFARSSIEADDKLPTPVFEKLGSGL